MIPWKENPGGHASPQSQTWFFSSIDVSRVALKIREDTVLLSNKNAGVSAEAFDITLTIMSSLKDYRDALIYILEVHQNFDCD
jgi:hypothetical protein